MRGRTIDILNQMKLPIKEVFILSMELFKSLFKMKRKSFHRMSKLKMIRVSVVIIARAKRILEEELIDPQGKEVKQTIQIMEGEEVTREKKKIDRVMEQKEEVLEEDKVAEARIDITIAEEVEVTEDKQIEEEVLIEMKVKGKDIQLEMII